VLDRLSKSKGENVAQSFLMKMMQKPMEFSAKRLDKKIQAVENNSKLSPEEKKARKNNLLDNYSRILNDLDGTVSQAGEVDTIVAGLKYAEVGGKVIMAGVMAKTVYDILEKTWYKIGDIFSDLGEKETVNEFLVEKSDKLTTKWPDTLFTDKGEKELRDTIEKAVGKRADKFFDKDMNVINSEVQGYLKGHIDEATLKKWLENLNDNYKIRGAKSDIIDVKAVMEAVKESDFTQRLKWLLDAKNKTGINIPDEEMIKIAKGNERIIDVEENWERITGKGHDVYSKIHKLLEDLPADQKEISPDGKTYALKTPIGEFKSFKSDRILDEQPKSKEWFDELKKWSEEQGISVTDEDINNAIKESPKHIENVQKAKEVVRGIISSGGADMDAF